MIKMLITMAICLPLGYFAKKYSDDYFLVKEKERIEKSLFQQINLLAPVYGTTCNPMFVTPTQASLTVYCSRPMSGKKELREEVRSVVLDRLKEWAANNKYDNRYLSVSFIDEIILSGNK